MIAKIFKKKIGQKSVRQKSRKSRSPALILIILFLILLYSRLEMDDGLSVFDNFNMSEKISEITDSKSEVNI